jgi:hypothetical protein
MAYSTALWTMRACKKFKRVGTGNFYVAESERSGYKIVIP